MSQYQLQLDVIASTMRLEQGLDKSVRLIKQTARKMDAGMKQFDSDRIGKKIGSGIMSGLSAAFGASLVFSVMSGALDNATKLATGEFKKSGMSAGGFFLEGFTQQLQSIPIAGSLGTLIGAMLGANEFEEMQRQREKQRQFLEEEIRLERASAESTRRIREAAAAIAEEERRKEEEATAKRVAARNAELRAIQDAGASFTLQIQPLETAADILKLQAKGDERGVFLLRQQLELRQDYWSFESKIVAARRSGQKDLEERLTQHRDLVRSQKELNHQLELEAFDREQAAKAEEELAKKRKEEAERLAKIEEKTKDAIEEFKDAREEAERRVAGATGTFQTAGGSFTTAVRAQLDEAKVMRSISEQSRDHLAQIVTNTALAFAGFS